MARLKKLLIVGLLLLVFVVGITFSHVDTGNPADGIIQIGEPLHVDRYNLNQQGGQSDQGSPAGQGYKGGQDTLGNQGSQSGSGIPDSPGSPDNPGPVGQENPVNTINPDEPANPDNPGPVVTITPADHDNPGDQNPPGPGNPADPGNNDGLTPISTPEFPYSGIPALFVIGTGGVVLLIRRSKDE